MQEGLRIPLKEYEEFSKMEQAVKNNQFPIQVTGCVESQKCHFICAIGEEEQYKIVVTNEEQKAKRLYEDASFFDKNVYYYPAKDVLFYSADVHNHVIEKQRLEVIKKIIEKKEKITIITTIDGLMDHLVPLEEIKKNIIIFEVQKILDLSKTEEKLTDLGYEKVSMVEEAGQYARRGGILDIYPLTEESPYRIELWGEEIDSIRSFDVQNQRSIEQVDSLVLYPAQEIILSPETMELGIERIEKEAKQTASVFRKEFKTEQAARIRQNKEQTIEELRELKKAIGMDTFVTYFYENASSLIEYLPKDETLFFIDEMSRTEERAKLFWTEFMESMKGRLEGGYMLPGQMKILFSPEETMAMLSQKRIIFLNMLMYQLHGWNLAAQINIETKSIVPYQNSFEQLVKEIKQWKQKKYKIILISPSTTRAKRLAENLRENDMMATFSEKLQEEILPGQIVTCNGSFSSGFEYPIIRMVFITEGDIFGKKIKKNKTKKSQYTGDKIGDFSELNVGDYVVHERHGLGIYRGIEQIVTEGYPKDYISIEYKGGSNLFIPATQLSEIQKYASASARKPKLNKLGGTEWEKTRKIVKSQVKKVAHDLVELYAIRQSKNGYAYQEDTVWQKEFEELFPYDETQDQLNAIEETKSDMESKKIMDRLICGDVGYGKTEVALRAAFKAVCDSKQVVYLVPTTILAQQHYNTFVERMKNFPVRVEMLSRFVTAKRQKEIFDGIKTGIVDIVIGTHKVLSDKIKYKDLGLLIVDEEQRFGVNDKEKMKVLKKDIDVLSLSATPIPRTLHMSLIGIRDMSVLEEAPVDRRAIQTYVLEYNKEMVKEAIGRELARGGQVYYVYNRVNNIEEITRQIQEIVPDAAVAFAHGQMSERQLERIMYDFMNGEIDVLVSTTIIETGLDISNANTMIIHDAQNFGLSQLYQLRGRIGRSSRSAYAFLMYHKDKLLKETAEKRLKAIREFTDLGSGYKIAMRDLEIRGAGNLLGADQSGHMAAVGYDLYCKMLNDAVREMKGEKIEEEEFVTIVDLTFDAYIPSTYIKNGFQKLDWYKKIASIKTEEDYDDRIDELIDRYGEIPMAVQNLLTISMIQEQAHQAHISQIEQKENEISFYMYEKAKIRVEGIEEMLKTAGRNLKFVAQSSPKFVLNIDKIPKKEVLSHVKNTINQINQLRY